MKKILITGATGFIGRNLVNKIDKHRYALSLLVRDKNKAVEIFGKGHDYIEFNENNLSYKNKIKKFNPGIVLHLASLLTSEFNTVTLKKLLDANIKFGALVLDALLDTEVEYFINTGSFSEYYSGASILDGAYLYSATKIAFRYILEFYRKIKDFKVFNLIPYTIYGPCDTRKKAMDYIIGSLDNKTPVDMTDGFQVLDFIFISDVVNFYLNLIERIHKIRDGCEYHLGTGVGTSIREVAAMAEQLSGKRTNINWGVRSHRARDIMRAVAPVEKTIKDLGWKPKVTLKEGLGLMLNSASIIK